MAHHPLYAGSVPVFDHYLAQLAALVDRTAGREHLLAARLASDMFSAAQQVATASGFALRVAYPLAGRAAPPEPAQDMDRIGLGRRIAAARQALAELQPADFDGAEARRIRHRAGFAELDQSTSEFLHLFGMPNFMFHASMAFAVLRREGLEIGKADFDGQHDYPHGFRF
ncbi:DUF1993 family protein [Gemmobacter serpentinus]|uniref:DUF1993 family protein n=1 Tax=Gemmobacter serpentinus TaxID=2652247 RepID=UPI001865724C|nr:DUF1993 family protein [Gemmobacter serpentinus]